MTCKSTFSVNAGSHPHLIVEAHAQIIPTSCVAHLEISLPSESFVDIYELSECIDSFNIQDRGVSQLEGPMIADSRMQTISIELRDLHLGQRIEIPLHMRYPFPQYVESPRSHSTQNVLFKSPSLSWTCGNFEPLESIMCSGNGPNSLLIVSLPLPPASSPKVVEMITSLAEMSTFIIAIYCLWMTYPYHHKNISQVK